MLSGNSRRPDILIVEPNVSPVVIETEIVPAASVEAEAIGRLGESLRATGRKLLSSIAVKLPVSLTTKSGLSLRREIAQATNFEMVLYAGTSPSNFLRWPQNGWLTGGLSFLSILAQAASVPPQVIEEAANELVKGVSEAAGLLSLVPSGASTQISDELRQETGEQTQRMAATILANAFVFHETLARGPGPLAAVKSLEELKNAAGSVSKSTIIEEWRKILAVNYWPIFDIARRILSVIPVGQSARLAARLVATAEKLLESSLMRSHDLTGAVFQRLIVDRKFLAAYYTTPSSAALLAALALPENSPPSGASWGSDADIKKLRIADFACGTGTLLSTTYQRIGQLHELNGGDAEKLHPDMMASAMVGCDVLPAAAHLTASMLAGAHPTVQYEGSRVLTVAYGRQANREVALGSIDLLEAQGELDILAITKKATLIGGKGSQKEETWLSIPDKAFDLVIMNPPFTRDTGHEGKKKGVPNPMFAAFRATKSDQAAMARRLANLTDGTSAHGNAGEASVFLVLADRKLKSDGVLAMVMPLSLVSGDAWEDSRKLLRKGYGELIIVSIAGGDDSALSFSADTDMGECLVVGRKGRRSNNRATFAVLDARPSTPLDGAAIGADITNLIAAGALRKLEDGPVGGTPLQFGSDTVGHLVDAPLPEEGGWNLSRVADISIAQAAYQLATNGRIWLPRMPRRETVPIPITTAASVGTIGPYHADIDGRTSSGGIRGPFDVAPLSAAPTYPMLWSHDAQHQQSMMFGPDYEGIIRTGSTPAEQTIINRKVTAVWQSASHCHVNRDFRFNSQSTTMQFTPQRAVGGRAWLSLSFPSVQQEKAMVIWSNTTFGVLLYWWHANKQQAGRGSIGKAALESMPVLDVTRITAAQLRDAAALFDALAGVALKPIHELASDAARHDLDEQFCRDILHLHTGIYSSGGTLELLREKLCAEPSIRGRK